MSGYWTRRRIGLGAGILVVGGLLIFRNVSERVEHVARSPLGAKCEASSDCSSGTCLRYNDRHICTEECSPSGQCGGSTHCAEVEVRKGNHVEKKQYCVP